MRDLRLQLQRSLPPDPSMTGDEVPPQARIELLDAAEAKYVSRGGLKLEAALRDCGIGVAGKRCLDVGQSTGGFTDCLLQHGAAQVTAQKKAVYAAGYDGWVLWHPGSKYEIFLPALEKELVSRKTP